MTDSELNLLEIRFGLDSITVTYGVFDFLRLALPCP